MAAMKAKEKEMKDEKEDERQVWAETSNSQIIVADFKLAATYTSNQGQEGGQGGEGAV